MFADQKISSSPPSGESKSSKEVLTGRELMYLLNISRTTLWKLRKEENLPYTKVGKKYLYLRSEIITWLKTQRGKKKKQMLIPLQVSLEKGNQT